MGSTAPRACALPWPRTDQPLHAILHWQTWHKHSQTLVTRDLNGPDLHFDDTPFLHNTRSEPCGIQRVRASDLTRVSCRYEEISQGLETVELGDRQVSNSESRLCRACLHSVDESVEDEPSA